MDEVKIKALKYTFVQMVACASIIFIISILVKYAPLMLSILSGVPHLIWWVMGVFAAVYVWYLINYSLIQTPLLSPWIERTSEQPPTCDLIHAELITVNDHLNVIHFFRLSIIKSDPVSNHLLRQLFSLF